MKKVKETAKEFIARKKRDFERNKKKLIVMKDIGRSAKYCFLRKAWTFLPARNHPEKIFVLERLEKDKVIGTPSHTQDKGKRNIVYRLGYFMVGKNGKANNRWVWGQYCPLISEGDLKRLLTKAHKEKVLSSPLKTPYITKPF